VASQVDPSKAATPPSLDSKRPDRKALAVAIALAASWLFAFHRLASWDPAAGVRNNPTGGFEGFFFAPAGSSPTLLLILAAWLTIRRRHDLFASMARPATPVPFALGLVLCLGASALSIWAHYVDFLGLMIPSLSLMLLGGGLLLAGGRGACALLTPALFLVLAYPHPAVALNGIIFPMQLWTAKITVWAIELVGLPATLAGDLILRPSGKVFQVIESCAGLRSIETLMMSAVVYAEVFGRRGLRTLLLVAAAPLVGMLMNQVRVLSLIANPFSNIDPVHTAQGLAMIVMGVLSVALLDLLLGRFLPNRFDRSWVRTVESWRPESDVGLREGMSRVLAFCVLLAVVGVSTQILPPWAARTEQLRPLSALPARLGDWQGSGLKLDEQFFGSVGFSQWMHRRYFLNKGDRGARVFLAADTRLEPRMSLISEKMAIPGPGYTLVEKTQFQLGADGGQADRLYLDHLGSSTLVFQWYLDVDSFSTELLRSAFGLDRGPHRRTGRAISARVSLQMPESRQDWPRAEQELAELARLVDADLRAP
jgi:exosortase